jgi:hypothetical protein
MATNYCVRLSPLNSPRRHHYFEILFGLKQHRASKCFAFRRLSP